MLTRDIGPNNLTTPGRSRSGEQGLGANSSSVRRHLTPGKQKKAPKTAATKIEKSGDACPDRTVERNY
jgi:hypothetical protein